VAPRSTPVVLASTVTRREVQPRRKTQIVIFLSDKLPIST